MHPAAKTDRRSGQIFSWQCLLESLQFTPLMFIVVCFPISNFIRRLPPWLYHQGSKEKQSRRNTGAIIMPIQPFPPTTMHSTIAQNDSNVVCAGIILNASKHSCPKMQIVPPITQVKVPIDTLYEWDSSSVRMDSGCLFAL